MTKKTEFILHEALTMDPSERALIAHSLISSLEEPTNENHEKAWVALAERRLEEIEAGTIETVSWEAIKNKIVK